jgi:hypothetical protein
MQSTKNATRSGESEWVVSLGGEETGDRAAPYFAPSFALNPLCMAV